MSSGIGVQRFSGDLLGTSGHLIADTKLDSIQQKYALSALSEEKTKLVQEAVRSGKLTQSEGIALLSGQPVSNETAKSLANLAVTTTIPLGKNGQPVRVAWFPFKDVKASRGLFFRAKTPKLRSSASLVYDTTIQGQTGPNKMRCISSLKDLFISAQKPAPHRPPFSQSAHAPMPQQWPAAQMTPSAASPHSHSTSGLMHCYCETTQDRRQMVLDLLHNTKGFNFQDRADIQGFLAGPSHPRYAGAKEQMARWLDTQGATSVSGMMDTLRATTTAKMAAKGHELYQQLGGTNPNAGTLRSLFLHCISSTGRFDQFRFQSDLDRQAFLEGPQNPRYAYASSQVEAQMRRLGPRTQNILADFCQKCRSNGIS